MISISRSRAHYATTEPMGDDLAAALPAVPNWAGDRLARHRHGLRRHPATSRESVG